MFYPWHPTPSVLASARSAAVHVPFSYDAVGATRTALPEHYDHDVQAVVVGRGSEVFARARAAMLAGRSFDIPWVIFDEGHFDVRAGAPLVYVSHQLCLYTVNSCRIVYAVDEPGDFAFAWGTLAGHPFLGEERLSLRLAANGDVVFEIRKFSRPAHVFVSLIGPFARRIQDRFSKDAFAALIAAVGV